MQSNLEFEGISHGAWLLQVAGVTTVTAENRDKEIEKITSVSVALAYGSVLCLSASVSSV